jgi:hypothetical protein
MKSSQLDQIYLQSTVMKEVSPFLGSTLSVYAEVFRKSVSLMNPFARRETAIHITLKNEGDKTISNAIVEISSHHDLKIVDPGAIFGVFRRHIRVPILKSGKEIKYKLALRPTVHFTSGTVQIEIKSANWQENFQEFRSNVAIVRQETK